jgi:hypothetical protein
VVTISSGWSDGREREGMAREDGRLGEKDNMCRRNCRRTHNFIEIKLNYCLPQS